MLINNRFNLHTDDNKYVVFFVGVDNHKTFKTEVDVSLGVTKKVEDTSNVVNAKPKTTKAKKLQTSTRKKIPQERDETLIQTTKAKLSPDKSTGKLELDKHRFNIRTLLQFSNATPIRTHYVGSGYICCFCKAHFPKATDLKTHTIQDHDDNTKNKFMQTTALFCFTVKLDITSLTCTICSMALETLEQLIDHLNNSHQKGLHTDIKSHIACFKLDEEVMKCHICSIDFNSFKHLQAHMNKHFSNFICDVCGTGFINQSQLAIHSDIHRVGTHNCSTCGKVFQSANKLKAHKRLTHLAASEKYKCYHCGEKFKNRNIKKIHMIEAHGVEYADLKCDACHRTFKSSKSLHDHKKRDHLMRRYPCGLCDSVFCRADRLKRHQVTHTGIREFKCELCSKSYTRKCTLTEHLRGHCRSRTMLI